MFSLALIALAAAAAPGDGMGQHRKAYEQCLQKLHDAEIEKKAAASQFDAAISTSCAVQETALKTAIIAHFVGQKIPRAEAEQSAKDWVIDVQEGAKERYRATLASGTPQSN
jgi:hypothetical protein